MVECEVRHVLDVIEGEVLCPVCELGAGRGVDCGRDRESTVGCKGEVKGCVCCDIVGGDASDRGVV